MLNPQFSRDSNNNAVSPGAVIIILTDLNSAPTSTYVDLSYRNVSRLLR